MTSWQEIKQPQSKRDPRLPPEQLVTKSFATVSPTETRWLLSGFIPFGSFTIIEGDGDVGKTTLALDVASRLSRGSAMPDGSQPGDGRVLIVAEEDSCEVLHSRLLAADADLSKIDYVTGVAGWGEEHFFLLPSDGDALLRSVKGGGYSFVLLDSMFGHLDASLNIYKPQDARRALRPLVETARLTQAAIVRHSALVKKRREGRRAVASDQSIFAMLPGASLRSVPIPTCPASTWPPPQSKI